MKEICHIVPVPCCFSTKNISTINTAEIVPILIPYLSLAILFSLDEH